MMTKVRLKRISPLRAGVLFAILYTFGGLLLGPLLIFQIQRERGDMGTAEAIILAIFLPVIYGAAAFLFGIIGAALYNLVASWTGGLELVVEKQDAGA